MKKNYFWGVFLILAGAYLVVSQLGYLPAVGVFSLLFTVVCIAVIVASIPHVHFGGILFPLAFIAIIYDKPLGITAITPWTVLLAALLLTIGLHLIFGRFREKIVHRGHFKKRDEWDEVKGEKLNDDELDISSTFGSVIRYITSEDFRYAEIDASFAGVKVYLDQARIPSGNATINIDSSFAGVELFVPKEWQIVNHVESSFGGIDEKNNRNGEVTATLTLEGSNNFGGITIYYV